MVSQQQGHALLLAGAPRQAPHNFPGGSPLLKFPMAQPEPTLLSLNQTGLAMNAALSSSSEFYSWSATTSLGGGKPPLDYQAYASAGVLALELQSSLNCCLGVFRSGV